MTSQHQEPTELEYMHITYIVIDNIVYFWSILLNPTVLHSSDKYFFIILYVLSH